MVRDTTFKFNGKRVMRAFLGDINLKLVRASLLAEGLSIDNIDPKRDVSGTPSLTLSIMTQPDTYDPSKLKKKVISIVMAIGEKIEFI